MSIEGATSHLKTIEPPDLGTRGGAPARASADIGTDALWHHGRVLLEIRGRNFPGRFWHLDDRPCHNVHVGIQRGRDPIELVAGDSHAAAWEVEIQVLECDSGIDFRGPAVQGRRGERFLYLTWGDVDDDGAFTMFRRAKLMLNDVEPLVSAKPPSQYVIATVDLTDERGGPRCARLRSPALDLRNG